jgi:hypothetical protein
MCIELHNLFVNGIFVLDNGGSPRTMILADGERWCALQLDQPARTAFIRETHDYRATRWGNVGRQRWSAQVAPNGQCRMSKQHVILRP